MAHPRGRGAGGRGNIAPTRTHWVTKIKVLRYRPWGGNRENWTSGENRRNNEIEKMRKWGDRRNGEIGNAAKIGGDGAIGKFDDVGK